VSWTIALAVGFGQLIAAGFPGASRSGPTILLALILGLNRVAATEFTFLVGIPTMLAASALKIFKAVHHAGGAPGENWSMLLLGFIVAALISFVVVKWLLGYVQTHTFVAFGWYRIGLAILIAILVLTQPGIFREKAASSKAAVGILPPILQFNIQSSKFDVGCSMTFQRLIGAAGF